MQRKTIVILIVIGIILFVGLSLIGWATGMYNSLVKLDESVNQAWAQVQNQYQRRLDLIPNLVETVKGYAAHESQVFTDVAEARASVGKLQMTPEILNNPQTFQRFQEAQASGADVLAVGCPFCMVMLTDASKADGGSMPVRDVAEIVADRLK